MIFRLTERSCWVWFQGVGQLDDPSVASSGRGSGWVRGQERPGSGRHGQGADAREDFVEQRVTGRQAQGERAGVADQPSRDADQPVPQGGDHGLAVADPVPEQRPVGCGGGGELV